MGKHSLLVASCLLRKTARVWNDFCASQAKIKIDRLILKESSAHLSVNSQCFFRIASTSLGTLAYTCQIRIIAFVAINAGPQGTFLPISEGRSYPMPALTDGRQWAFNSLHDFWKNGHVYNSSILNQGNCCIAACIFDSFFHCFAITLLRETFLRAVNLPLNNFGNRWACLFMCSQFLIKHRIYGCSQH